MSTTTVVDSTTSSLPTTTVVTTTTAPPAGLPVLTFSDPPTEAALFALADAYWNVFDAASLVPDPNHPGLEQYIGEPLLTRTRENLGGFFSRGEHVEPSLNPHIYHRLSAGPDMALIEDCFVDDGRIVESATGSIVNDAVIRFVVQIELRREAVGLWKVSNQYGISETENGSCDSP